MRKMRLSSLASAALVGTLAAASPVSAQDATWRPFVSVTPFFESEADLDRGGDFSFRGVLLRAGTSRGFGAGNRAGVVFSYDYYDSSFSSPVSFGGVAPWNNVQHYGVGAPLAFALGEGWTLGLAPSVDWFKENGARTGDSLVWGATVSAIRASSDGNRLGLGVAAFAHIEDTKVFPVVIVDWRLSDRWRLVNPLASGPTGPAGLELDYQFDNDWSLGIGGAFRVTRFRLSESGPVSNGVGEISGVPVFLRATRNLESLTLSLYLGAVANGRLRVEDPTGNLLREDDFDLAPLVGLSLSGSF